MPIKSKAQRRKFAELLVKGEISPETFEEWNRGAGGAELPERLHPKARRQAQAQVKDEAHGEGEDEAHGIEARFQCQDGSSEEVRGECRAGVHLRAH